MMRRTTTTTALTGLTGFAALLVVGAMVAVPPAQAADESCDGRPATIVVTTPTSYPIVPVVGTPGDDVIVGSTWTDIIDGAGGNDVICGLGGGDELTGGTGDDRLFGGLDQEHEGDDAPYVGDLLVPGLGDDHVDLGVDLDSLNLCDCVGGVSADRVSYADAAAGVRVNLETGVATGEGRDTIVSGGYTGVIGSPFDDYIVGTDLPNLLKSGAGKDTVEAGDGDDAIHLDAMPTTAHTNGLPVDALVAESGDVLDAGAGLDYIVFAGGDSINSGSGNDTLRGESNARGSVHSNNGRDSIYITGTGPMTVRGGAGKDLIIATYARQGGYTLDGGSGFDDMRIPIAPNVPQGRMTINLPQRRISVAGHKPTVRLTGAESISVIGQGRKKSGLTFIGTGRDDTFAAFRVAFSVRAYGRGGDDTLYGGYAKDLLDGGPGRDNLTGARGRDQCVNGEKFTDCEIRSK